MDDIDRLLLKAEEVESLADQLRGSTEQAHITIVALADSLAQMIRSNAELREVLGALSFAKGRN